MALSADAVISAASGLGGILVGSGIVVAVVKSKFARVDKLEDRLTDVTDRRVEALERGFEDLKHDGCSVGTLVKTKLETVISQNNELLLEVKKLNRESENQSTRLETVERSASKLWDKFDEHRQHHPGAAPKGE